MGGSEGRCWQRMEVENIWEGRRSAGKGGGLPAPPRREEVKHDGEKTSTGK